MIRFLLIICLISTPAFATNTLLQQAKQDMGYGHYASAMKTLQRLVKTEPDNYEAWFMLGVTQVHEQHDHQAIESFKHVIQLRPNLAEPHNNLAAVYNNLGDTKAAIKELETALKKRPNYAVAEENLADLHIKLALQHYRNSLSHGAGPEVEQRYTRLLNVRNLSTSTDTHIATNPSQQNMITTKAKPSSSTPVVHPVSAVDTSQPSNTSDKTKKSPETQDTYAAENEDISITSVLDALEAWRQAWSNQDLDAYFSSYATDFKPDARFQSVEAWKAYKKRVIKNKAFINVQLEQVTVDIPANLNIATISLLQHFSSNTYVGDDHKTIVMKYTPKGWKIISEVSKP